MLDRASDYESEGRGFKSHQLHHLKSPFFLILRKQLMNLSQMLDICYLW
jgi:hypothetical protein